MLQRGQVYESESFVMLVLEVRGGVYYGRKVFRFLVGVDFWSVDLCSFIWILCGVVAGEREAL